MPSNKYTLGNLANDCNIRVSDLLKPIQRIMDFAYDQVVLDVSENISHKEMIKIIDVLKSSSATSKYKHDYVINPTLYNFVKEQHDNANHLVSISEIAKENHFSQATIWNILQQWKTTNWQLANKNFVHNIFKSTKRHYVSDKKKNLIVQLFLAQMAVENRLQSGWVKTSDIALTTRNSSIQVFLLEQVQDTNSTKGRVIAFGKRDDRITIPIVRWYNGSIGFAPNLQRSPRSNNSLNFKRLKINKRVCCFVIPLKDVTNQKDGKRNIQIFNAFLRMLAGKSVEISISLKSMLEPLNSSTTSSGRIYLKLNPTKVNMDKLSLDDDTQNARTEKIKAYGKNGVSNEEMLAFLSKYTDKSTNTHVTLTNSKSNPLSIYSSSYPVTTFLPDRASFDLIKQRAKENGLTIGQYISYLSGLNESELQLSVYEADARNLKLHDQEKLEMKVGKHVLKKDNLTLDKVQDNEVLVRNYFIKYDLPKDIRDIILNDPLIAKEIADKLSEK